MLFATKSNVRSATLLVLKGLETKGRAKKEVLVERLLAEAAKAGDAPNVEEKVEEGAPKAVS